MYYSSVGVPVESHGGEDGVRRWRLSLVKLLFRHVRDWEAMTHSRVADGSVEC